MNPDQVQHAYEAIQNPILRLLVYFLAGAVAAMAAAIVYLYRDRQSTVRELTSMNQEISKAYAITASALESLSDQMAELRQNMTKYLIKSKS